MTENDSRTGPVRDVPPPRPVAADPGPAGPSTTAWLNEDAGLGRAARAVADAVGTLLGSSGSETGAGSRARASAAGVMRDVVGAFASAASGRRSTGAAPVGDAAARGDGGAVGGAAATARRDRGPAALLGDLLSAAAPRLPIRDAARLRAAHPGLSDEEIADVLVARAARMAATVGAATGGLSAVQWFAPPALLALPLEIGAEAVLTAAVEIVLIGELHELYGRPAPGDARERATAYLHAWSRQQAVDGANAGLVAILSSAGLRQLRSRMSRRMVRSVPGAAPFLLGAAVAGRANRKSTEGLAQRIRSELRRGPRQGSGRS